MANPSDPHARAAARRGFDRVVRRAVLGDGAKWIWNLADAHVPDAVQIVDRFHAKQHLSDVGKAIYGATSEGGRVWSQARRDELDEGKTEAIGTRLQRTGMHWTVAGADAIIALRCCTLSGRFEEFWEHRAQQRAA